MLFRIALRDKKNHTKAKTTVKSGKHRYFKRRETKYI